MQEIVGIILAGGKSTRMGAEKALAPLAGKPVLAHVIERFAPQVTRLALNANGDPARFLSFGLPVISDADGGGGGPLGGIAAGLAYAARCGAPMAAFCPCDAPFAPRDLVERLAAAAPVAIRMARHAAGLEPLFSLWSVDGLVGLQAALSQGASSVHATALALGAVVVDFPQSEGEPDWAFNLNQPADVQAAQAWLAKS